MVAVLQSLTPLWGWVSEKQGQGPPGSKEFWLVHATEGQWSQEIPLVPAFYIPTVPGSRH